MRSYQQAVDYMYRLQWYGQKLGLQNISSFLKTLNDPHKEFHTLHVAGTNGKGSTAAMVAAILQAQGYRVGLYTSPHLISFTERIRINGKSISTDSVTELTQGLLSCVPSNQKITFFEFTTAMAFLYFFKMKVDLAVVEVGLGGRLDATNVIHPLGSIITNISYDHEEHLGKSLSAIAFEKAGIVKPGVPTVTAAVGRDVIDTLSKECEARGSSLYQIGKDFSIEEETPSSFTYSGRRFRWSDLSLNLLGRHQLRNAACALAALEVLSEMGIDVSEESVREGLRTLQWEGRLEIIEIPSGPRIYLDGAHNPAGSRVLREFLIEDRTNADGKLILVMGIMKEKNIAAMFRELLPLAHTVILTRADYHRAASLNELEAAAQPFAIHTSSCDRISEAIDRAQSIAGPNDCICVTGSLFTVGEARAILRNLEAPSPLKG